jgi:hypothetical protein
MNAPDTLKLIENCQLPAFGCGRADRLLHAVVERSTVTRSEL